MDAPTFFTGREKELNDLKALLKTSDQHVFNLYGMGGIGKRGGVEGVDEPGHEPGDADREAQARGEVLDEKATGIDWASKLHAIKIPPMVHFHQAGIYCSAWLPIFVSFATGVLAGILGIGGGLIRMPCLVYLIGCPTHIAVGTDLFEVAISGLYGAATYTLKGRTELVAALIMLIGAAIGAQIGAVATKYIRGYGIRAAFGAAVIGCLCSVVLKLSLSPSPATSSLR